MQKTVLLLIAIVLFIFTANIAARGQSEDQFSQLKLPPNFSISLYAKVPGARSIEIVPELNSVFVGTRGDVVYQIQDDGLKGRVQSVSVFAKGLKVPNGIAYKDGKLYIAEQHRIISVTIADKKQKILVDNLPDDRWHGWRYMALGPNGKLYVSIGSPCNVCEVQGIEGTILEVDPVSGKNSIFAAGVRNSVGIDFHPISRELYFTDNGSDGLGDDIPADELNHAPISGLHFGFPWFGGGSTKSDEFLDETPPTDVRAPAIDFQAHTASLGLMFYRGDQFPNQYKNSIFVAQHGSWNRTVPIGYRIMLIKLDDSRKPIDKSVFAQGWLQGEENWGRVVDLKEMPDGSILVSDDKAGVIYQITYSPVP